MADKRMLGLALRIVRELRDLTQEALADGADISRGTVIDYEAGKQATDYGFSAMLEVLDVREGLLQDFATKLETLVIAMKAGRDTLDGAPPQAGSEQDTVYLEASAPRSSGLEVREQVTGSFAGIEQVVMDGARFLRSLLQWVVVTLAPKPSA